ncbi:hypothetical protein GGR42_002164 [Saonia flava]|uniref:Uncharacterized protein n=1 Tax=Saonia flava TaxID=523696 RepID=A0A846QYI2_9FLAO|nr:hypothetical protein [Saonia flava]NJB71702.1 hypothetical protein [Saonia flava]
MKNTLKKGLLLGIGYVLLKWTLLGLIGTYLYKKGMWSNWYFLILPVIGLTVFFIRKKKKAKNGKA